MIKKSSKLSNDKDIQALLKALSESEDGLSNMPETAQNRLAEQGYYALGGYAVLNNGSVTLISSADEQSFFDAISLFRAEQQSTAFNDSGELPVHFVNGQTPYAFNLNYDSNDKSRGPVKAPLGKIVILRDSRHSGLVKVTLDEAFNVVDGGIGSSLLFRKGVMGILRQVPIVGYNSTLDQSPQGIYAALKPHL